jgi:group I intron endonuclease
MDQIGCVALFFHNVQCGVSNFEDNVGYIYMFTNIVNNKSYIGQTWHLKKRLNEHIRGCGYAELLCRALKKYGADAFSIRVLYRTMSQEALDRAEIHLIKIAGTLAPYGYKIALGGARGRHSEATKKLIGLYHMGKVVSMDAREKLRLANTGRKMTEAARTKISSSLATMHSGLDYPVYVFECLTHCKVFESPTRAEALKRYPELIYDTLRHSLVSPCYKFRLGGSWCYARIEDKPETGLFHRIGKPVQITYQDGSTQLFANLVVAREHLKVKRGVIEGCIQRQSSSSYVYNGEFVNFRAAYFTN